MGRGGRGKVWGVLAETRHVETAICERLAVRNDTLATIHQPRCTQHPHTQQARTCARNQGSILVYSYSASRLSPSSSACAQEAGWGAPQVQDRQQCLEVTGF